MARATARATAMARARARRTRARAKDRARDGRTDGRSYLFSEMRNPDCNFKKLHAVNFHHWGLKNTSISISMEPICIESYKGGPTNIF